MLLMMVLLLMMMMVVIVIVSMMTVKQKALQDSTRPVDIVAATLCPTMFPIGGKTWQH